MDGWALNSVSVCHRIIHRWPIATQSVWSSTRQWISLWNRRVGNSNTRNPSDPAVGCWQRGSSLLQRKNVKNSAFDMAIATPNNETSLHLIVTNISIYPAGLSLHCSCTGIPCRDQSTCVCDISYAQTSAIFVVYNDLLTRTTFTTLKRTQIPVLLSIT